jgi:hypothetical protein
MLGRSGNVTVPRPSIEPGASSHDLQRYSDPTSEAVWCLIGRHSESETGLSSQ